MKNEISAEEEQQFSLRHITSEIPIRHPHGNIG